ncbi:MAG: tetratricopeptide repeat protein [Methylacidiphilales bacterium]|nr:tetratricopeptide repeat protein [Candidatus Methylacidiphilales bacterium]
MKKQNLTRSKIPPPPHNSAPWTSFAIKVISHPYFLITAAICILYFQLKDFKFLSWDDHATVQYNHRLHPPTFQTLTYYWTPVIPKEFKQFEDIYIPLTYTVWAALALISDSLFPDTAYTVIHPSVYHLANVAVHILTTTVIYLILTKLIRKISSTNSTPLQASRLALFGALLYAVHPLQVEPVCWVSGMKDMLCAFFGYLAVWGWLSYLEAPQRSSTARWAYGLGLLAFFFACTSKPQAINVPILLVILSIGIYRIPLRTLGFLMIPWFILTLATAVLAKILQPDKVIATLTPLWTRPLVALDALSFYLIKVVFPVNLCFDYSRTPEYILKTGQLYYSWLPSALVFIAAACSRHRRLLLTLLLLFAGGFASVSGIVPFYSQNVSTVSDRYMLFPMFAVALGGALLISYLHEKFPKYTRLISSTATALLLILAVLSFYQISTWRDDRTFYTQSAKINPRSYRALNNLALYYHEKGLSVEAEKLLLKCRDIKDTDPLTYSNLAMVQYSQKRYTEARANALKAIEIKPNLVYALNHMGLIETALGNHEQALQWHLKAHQESPHAFPFAFNLANAALRAHREDIAIQAFEKALAIVPDHTQCLNDLGALLIKQNRLTEALPYIEKAIYLDMTSNPGFIQNWFTLQQRLKNPITPSHPVVRLKQADTAALKEKDPSQALKILNSLIVEHPDIISAYHRIAGILRSIGRIHESDQISQQALKRARLLGYRSIVYTLESYLISRGYPIKRTVIQED